MLVRSKHAETRETGVGRVNRWHSGDAALPTVVAQGGGEALLATLPTAQPETRVTVLELLVRMAPVADARGRLVANDAAARAAASCATLGGADPAVVGRCEAQAAALAEALR